MLNIIKALQKELTLKSCGTFLFLMLLFVAPLLAVATSAHAATTGESTTCAKQLKPSSTTPGKNIVSSVFASINSVLSKVGKAMYQGIVANSKFQNVVAVCMSLYIALYGAMVMLNMTGIRMSDVVARLLRVAIIYGFLSFSATGWALFDQYFSAFFLGGMNELIFNFAVAAGVPVVPPVTVSGLGIGITPSLDVAAVSALYGPMNVVYQPFFLFAILGLLFLNIVCTVMALAMMWAFWDFTMMILGALITYVRAVVGLTFLFGIAPIFIIFLLFPTTRVLFFGWVNQCVSFAIAPVLLFAFLSFYTVLLTNVLNGLFANVDFCWGKMTSVPGTTTDIGMWRPTMYVPDPTGAGKSWILITGDWTDTNGTPLPPPFSIVSVLLFVIICHLGKQFSKHIETLTTKISGGIGPGVVTGEAAGQFIGNKVTGGRGFSSLMGSAFSRGSKAPITSAGSTAGTPAAKMASQRKGL